MQYNDKWERTKRYLFRNLLVDPGFRLSPIPEERRSDSSEDRPYSPLPDLIIEREPNRHDDSEEFYDALERKMKKYYKKLFIDGVDVEGSVEYEDLSNIGDGISDFEVNRSMASTYILDINKRTSNEEERVSSQSGPEPEDNRDENTTQDDILTVYKYVETESADSSNAIEADGVDLGRDTEHREVGNARDINSEKGNLISTYKFEVSNVFNESENHANSNEFCKKISTESDSTQDCHRISTTIAEIHDNEERTRGTRVFEDGSPVLMPNLLKLNRNVFGSLPRRIKKMFHAGVNDEMTRKESVNDLDEPGIQGESQLNTNEVKELKPLEANEENSEKLSDLEVEWLMKGTDTNSNITQNSNKTFNREKSTESRAIARESFSKDDQESFNDDLQEENSENLSDLEVKRLIKGTDTNSNTTRDTNKTFNSEKSTESRTKARESLNKDKEESINAEHQELMNYSEDSYENNTAQMENDKESIGPDEFPYTCIQTEVVEEEPIESEDNSFETALRKGVFERKNKRIMYVYSSDEETQFEITDRDDLDPVETMRGAKLATLNEAFWRRASLIDPDSPAGTFAVNAPTEKLEESSDGADHQINASGEVSGDEADLKSLRSESASLQSDPADGEDTQQSARHGTAEKDGTSDEPRQEHLLIENRKSTDNRDNATPPRMSGIEDPCNAIWSVSPIQINVEELLPKNEVCTSTGANGKGKPNISVDTDDGAPTIKRKKYNKEKKNKYNNIATQTSASEKPKKSWNEIKSNFFVGTPLIFRLCNCPDHICP